MRRVYTRANEEWAWDATDPARSSSARDSDGPNNFRRVRRSPNCRRGSRSREKRKTRAGKRKGEREEESGEHLSEIGNERTPMRTERYEGTKGGRGGGSWWHLTLSESGHVHCSPLILVLAVALSNASIGGSRRFECSLYFPLRLPSPSPLFFLLSSRETQREKRSLEARSKGSCGAS